MVLKDDVIFVQVKFTDEDGTNYGIIDQSEIDGETFVFNPGSTGEIFPNVMEEAVRIMKTLNDDAKGQQHI